MTIMTEKRVNVEALKEFCVKVFTKMGVSQIDAEITADNLVSADLRGIPSHGVARLARYVKGLKDGVMIAKPEEKVIKETPTTILVDAGAGLGQPVSHRAMNSAIKKAVGSGVGFASVRNSNHYGIAGYYSMMALEHDMIGISMTNSASLVVPTFGKDAILGTNPISLAVPAGSEMPYVLDMATSTVPRGKLEVYDRQEKDVPMGWATDEDGVPTKDPGRVLRNVLNKAGGGLLPLGGAGEDMSGHKGYGLGLLVEILCGVLSGAGFGLGTYPKDENGNPLPSNIGHFFGAIRIDFFRPLDEFKMSMDSLIKQLKYSERAKGEGRIFIHGEKEFEKAGRHVSEGVPVHTKVDKTMKEIAAELGIDYNL